MSMDKIYVPSDEANPYIALADLAINLVLILAFFVAAVNALGRAGWEQVRYRDAQKEFRQAVSRSIHQKYRPSENRGKNDPPGVQRWVFRGAGLFEAGTTRILPGGERALAQFASVLKKQKSKWRRVRIEGHTLPPSSGELDNWELSSARAAVVARIVQARGHIPSHFLGVSGRAGQAPLLKVMLYGTPGEKATEQIRYFLQQRGVTFSLRNVKHQKKAREELEGLGVSRTPVTVAEGKPVIGYDPPKLARAIAAFQGNARVEILVEYSQPSPTN